MKFFLYCSTIQKNFKRKTKLFCFDLKYVNFKKKNYVTLFSKPLSRRSTFIEYQQVIFEPTTCSISPFCCFSYNINFCFCFDTDKWDYVSLVLEYLHHLFYFILTFSNQLSVHCICSGLTIDNCSPFRVRVGNEPNFLRVLVCFSMLYFVNSCLDRLFKYQKIYSLIYFICELTTN